MLPLPLTLHPPCTAALLATLSLKLINVTPYASLQGVAPGSEVGGARRDFLGYYRLMGLLGQGKEGGLRFFGGWRRLGERC